MPAVFAYDLPTVPAGHTGVKPASPVRVPMVSCVLSERQTQIIVELCRAHELGLHAVLVCRYTDGGVATSGQTRTSRFPSSTPSICGTFSHRRCPRPGARTRSGLATYLAEIDHKTHCGRPCPRHRRNFSDGPVRRCDPAISAALQPAIRWQRTGIARCRIAFRQRTGASRTHASRCGSDQPPTASCTSQSAPESRSTSPRYSPDN